MYGMKSLLSKAQEITYNNATSITCETEKNIILSLLELTTIMNNSLDSKSLNEIADYLYVLTSQYNKFYSENRVLTEEDKKKQESWLVLTKVVYNVNSMLLDILGIKVPEKI